MGRDASYETIDPKCEGSRQESFATVGMTSLEGPHSKEYASPADIRHTSEALIQAKA